MGMEGPVRWHWGAWLQALSVQLGVRIRLYAAAILYTLIQTHTFKDSKNWPSEESAPSQKCLVSFLLLSMHMLIAVVYSWTYSTQKLTRST